MSTSTTNYGLIKPELTDAADITATNENWDKIDAELKKKTAIPVSSDVPTDAYLWIDPNEDTVEENHVTDKNNPHNVTASQVGAIPNPVYVADMDTMTEFFGLVDINTANMPNKINGFALNLYRSDFSMQYVFYTSTPGSIVSRVKVNGKWGAWSKVEFTMVSTTDV